MAIASMTYPSPKPLRLRVFFILFVCMNIPTSFCAYEEVKIEKSNSKDKEVTVLGERKPKTNALSEVMKKSLLESLLDEDKCAESDSCQLFKQFPEYDQFRNIMSEWERRLLHRAHSDVYDEDPLSNTNNELFAQRRLSASNDVLGLQALYQATNGPNWKFKTNWMNEVGPCNSSWTGVTCSVGSVIALNLLGLNLEGSLPTQLGLVSGLSLLILDDNILTGSVPSQFGQLTMMTGPLFLPSNNLTSSIPSQLGLLTLMTHQLSFVNNQFSGRIPSELGLLTAMTSGVRLSSNSFSGSIPSQFGQLSVMVSNFRLESNALTGTIPSELGEMTAMTSDFYLNENSLSGSIPSELGQLTELKTNFDLSSNRFCDNTLPSEVASLSSGGSGFYIFENNMCSNFEALGYLYISTNGVGWVVNTNWLNDYGENPCPSGDWYGVACSGSEVIGLRLGENNLNGTLPSQVGLLSNLWFEFTFYANMIHGSIPSEIGLLSGLEQGFDFNANQLTGSIPSELGAMSAMNSFFSLDLNSLTGFIPSEIGQMTLLTEGLQLNINMFSGPIPSQLGQLSLFTEDFGLNANLFSGAVPSQLGQLSKLVSGFKLNNNTLSGPLPSQLGMLSLLTNFFSVELNALEGSIPSELGQLTSLTAYFRLSSNALSGSIPSQLSRLSVLTSWFDVSANQLTGSLPTELGQLTLLEKYFYVSTNSLSGSVPSELGQLILLSQHLSLGGNRFDGRIPSELGQLSLLVEGFYLHSNSLSGSIPTQVGTLSRLQGDLLLYSNSLTGNFPSELALLTDFSRNLFLYSNQFCSTIPESLDSWTSSISSVDIWTDTNCEVYDILAALYNSTYGANWTMNSNWLSNKGINPCSIVNWYGLTCDGDVNVATLSLGGNRLYGYLPSQLGGLSTVTEANFASNFLSGSIPSELGQWTSMISDFYFQDNKLSGSVPSQLGQMTLIGANFGLSSNHFTGSIPSQLGRLSLLEVDFLLNDNSFTGHIPTELGGFTTLNSGFYLNDNSLSGQIPSELGDWSVFTESFYTSYNQFCGAIPTQVTALVSEMGSYDLVTGNVCKDIEESLRRLYNVTSGASWSINSNWMTGSPCPSGDWYGVTCSGSGVDVVGIELASNNILGSLPSELGYLDSLTIFTMSSNTLTGLIPSELGKLTALKDGFKLHRNSFSGWIPSELGRLTVLTSEFQLFLNDISGPLPSQLGLLSKLTSTFAVYSNRLSGSIPSEVGQLTAINSYVYFQYNSFNQSLPTQLGRLSLVNRVFQFGNNMLTGQLPSELGSLKFIENYFSFDSNSLSGAIPSQLGLLVNMKADLELFTNRFTGPIPSQIGLLSLMTTAFQLHTNSVSGSLPSQLGLLTGMSSGFQLFDNAFSQSIPSQLGELTKLQTGMQLYSNKLTGVIPSQLGRLSALLSNFFLHTNSLSGAIPSELGLLTSFTSSFSVYSNAFCSSIPSELTTLLSNQVAGYDIDDILLDNTCIVYEALSALYESTGGVNWYNNSNWLNNVGLNPCPSGNWFGVTCSSSDVISIGLETNNLVGSLPSQVGLLSTLSVGIELALNSITGAIPSQLGMLSKLGSLFDLSENQLSGTIPSELGLLSLLSGEFSLNNNYLSGSLPSQIGIISLLRNGLVLGENSLDGSLPSQLGQLIALTQDFDLRSNLFSSQLPSQIGRLSSLKTDFLLFSNSLAGTIPTQFGLLSLLTYSFELSSNMLSGSIPSELGELTGIKYYFRIFSNSLSSAIPTQLGRFSNLIYSFDVYYNSLSGLLPSQLGQLTSLERNFRIISNQLTGSLPSEIGQLTKLSTHFEIAANSFTNSLPSQIGRLSSLVSSLRSFSNSFSGSLPSQLGRLSLLTTRFLFHSNQFTGSVPTQLGAMSALQDSFYLSSNSFSGRIPSELGRLSSLTEGFELSSNLFCSDLPAEVSALSSQVNVSYSVLPGNAIGTVCCIGFPLVYTCAPTILPSPLPTPVPTEATERPTSLPTPLPSMIPSSQPTPLPSSSPTPNPTLSPSPQPTLVPTSSPTPVPTVRCLSGTYLSGNTCVDCPIGYYSINDTPQFAEVCTQCPAGKYNTQAASASCTDCAVGKISSSDRTFCKDCEAGEYNFNNTDCIECERGKYAPQALTDSCLECAAGSHTNNGTKATTCTACDAGTWSNESSVKCSACEVGKFSSSGSPSCRLCEAGSYASSISSPSCTACSAGTYASNRGASNCTSCAKGQYQGSTSQSQCNYCDAGKYSYNVGEASCESCNTGRTSSVGSDSCDLAAVGYYLAYDKSNTDISLIESKSCPAHAVCVGRYQMPVPTNKYWVDYTSHKYAGTIVRCARDTCFQTPNQLNSSCWSLSHFNMSKSQCDYDKLMCKKGSGGPLCGACLEGYVYQGISKSCKECASATLNSYLFAGCLIFMGLIVMVYMYMGDALNLASFVPMHYLSNIDSGSLKVMWVTYQIVVSSSFTLGIEYPSPFSGMLQAMSIFSLEFLALECLDSPQDWNVYYVTVLLWCLLPVVIAAIIILVGFIRRAQLVMLSSTAHRLAVKSIYNQHIWCLLLLSYLVLPPVSNKQLQVFDCISLESSARYLRSDTSIDCNSASYKQFRGVIILFVALYQLIPIAWMIILYKNRTSLNPPTSNHDEKLSAYIRDNNPDLIPLKFLFVDYKCNKWWFEIADMYRRIIFIGIVPLISPNPATRASFGCILAILSVAYFREEQPYRVDFTNVIAHIAQFGILVTFYGALTIETTSMINFGLKGVSLGVFLLLVNMIILFLSFWFAWEAFHKQREQSVLKESKVSMNEDARGFSAVKFNTTFEAIWRSSVPASHTLVFHYTSYERALSARKSGIAAQERFNGVPLTLRQPHATVTNDFNVFRQVLPRKDMTVDRTQSSEYERHDFSNTSKEFPCEEVLVLSLPKQFLDPLKGYEQDAELCMISAEVLKALRPTSFTAIVNSQPWLDGMVLLSPFCILRSFLIMDTADNQRSISTSTSRFPSQSALLRVPSMFVKDDQEDVEEEDVHTTKEPLTELLPKDSVTEESFEIASLKVQVKQVSTLESYLSDMSRIRQRAFESKLVPLYHYTSPAVAPLILRSGLRMSTQGQGDGGVYVSTQGPASYGLGTDHYERNIIIDCFGLDRLEEYEGQGKLDVVIVYGCAPTVLLQAPGGRVNAKMISKSTFKEFSLEHANGNYFLRPDRILGCFQVQPHKKPKASLKVLAELQVEKIREKQLNEKLQKAEEQHHLNLTRIDKALSALWKSLNEVNEQDVVFNEESEELGNTSSAKENIPLKRSSPKGSLSPFHNGRFSGMNPLNRLSITSRTNSADAYEEQGGNIEPSPRSNRATSNGVEMTSFDVENPAENNFHAVNPMDRLSVGDTSSSTHI